MGFDDGVSGDGTWWLLKVPLRLGTEWNEAPAGTLLGEVEVSASSNTQLRVIRGSQSTSGYDLVRQVGGTDVPMRPFRRVTHENEVRGSLVGGQPRASFGLKPQRGIGYRRDLRTRMFESMQATRVTQTIDDADLPSRVSKPITIFKRNREEQQTSSKRTRSQVDRGGLKSLLLALLSAPHDPMAFKEISKRVGEPPQGQLKDALGEIADKQKGEGGRVTFHLKPEYRDNSAAA
ncbi:hypothetical protein CTAYLR_001843 [Chrysophaeum taylorii]|uniref:Transcription initiation factor IIF subunit beta n=1 Tax=Chrysophaeum taylorii TaxID=2483200 RepID=A0AAD7U881_9STRA|nr:hypothetical protein CTAYLR_001843 [Chrysophaeum taylorii]